MLPCRVSFEQRHDAGFSFIEVLVVMGIFALLAGLGLFLSMDVYRGDTFRAERDTLISVLSKARNRSLSNINQMPHGVRIENTPPRYIIFRGAVYNPSDPSNEIIVVEGKVTNNGPKEFIFTQLSGDVVSPDAVTITDGVKTVTISISDEGQINW